MNESETDWKWIYFKLKEKVVRATGHSVGTYDVSGPGLVLPHRNLTEFSKQL